MSNTDKSASARTKAVRNKTLAVFHKSNPKAKEAGGSNTFPGEFLIERVAGQSSSDCCSTDCSSDVIKSFIGVNTDGDLTFPTGGNNTPGNEYYFDVSWFSVPGATSYTITSTLKDLTIPTPPDLIVLTGPNSARITTYYTEGGNVDRIFTLTAQTSCGTSSKILQINSCFLAGSLVQMVNGTKAIEDVCVGDQVVGAFGEINTVLALHRPLLGNALMCKINDEHSTTNHHPHISADKKFFCGNPDIVSNTTYGKVHKVIDGEGNVVDRMLHGLKKDRIQLLQLGVELKTVEGSRITKSLETYSMPEDTQLYNLVIGGSHTYHVDGYAVTGWPREDDFDYDAWAPIPIL